MRRIGSFLLGIVVGGVLVFFAQRYHVVRTDQGVEFVPKLQSGLSDTYVDIRKFQATDWANHKALAAAIVQAQKDHILSDSASDQVRQGVGRLVDELKALKSS
ncbi:MAG: hypothetical protein HYX69_06250 [Planctomycetia bacterium]|nr:hypothetical protein [Planctomycetia bacterium]